MEYHSIEEGKLLEEDLINYNNVDLESNIEDNEKMCRICLEEDNIDDFFAPCKCKGTSKWVHRECLNQWRATSTNREAFNKCMECKYNYNIHEQILQNTFFRKCNLYLARNTFFFFFINQSIILGFSLLTRALDPQERVPEIFKEYIDVEIISYYLLTTLIYIGVVVLGFLLNFLMLRNKSMYCKYYSKITKCHVIFSILSVLVLIVIIPIIGILFLTLLVQSFIKYHYKIIEKLDRANNMEIIEYDEDDTNSDEINIVDGENNSEENENYRDEFTQNVELRNMETQTPYREIDINLMELDRLNNDNL